VNVLLSNSIRISGATGVNGSPVNGNYFPTDEVYNGITVFKKEGTGGIWLEYNIANKIWQLNLTSDRGNNGTAWGKLPCEVLMAPERCPPGKWIVYGGSSHDSQPNIRVEVVLYNTLRINGASGVNGPHVNGIYIPTSETRDGVSAYKKEGAEIWLEYCAVSRYWQLILTEDRGSDGKAWAKLPCDIIMAPERTIPGRWTVYDGSSFVHQSAIVVDAILSNTIRVAGATGVNGPSANGTYVPTAETRNGVTVLKKVGDSGIWMEYSTANRAWQLNLTADRGNDGKAWARLPCDIIMAPELCAPGRWSIYDGTSFADQCAVVVEVVLSNTIKIAGATGVNGPHVNGTYKPSKEMYNGVTVFQKEGVSNIWLEYNLSSRVWQLNLTEDRGNGGKAWGKLPCPVIMAPEQCKPGQWTVYDGTSHVRQPDITVGAILSRSVRISGATGVNGPSVNGTYAPTAEMHGGVTVFKKEGSNIWLEYNATNRLWQLNLGEDRGNNGKAWGKFPSDMIMAPEHCTPGNWTVYDGKDFVKQTQIVVEAI
jgi:hypothetical protein